MGKDLTSQLGAGIFQSVTFTQLTQPVFSAYKIGSVFAIWESDYLDGDVSLIAWKSIIMSAYKPAGSDIYLFIANADSNTEKPAWYGPYRNNDTIITEFSKRYMKIRAIMLYAGEYTPSYQYSTTGPSISSISLQCMTSQNSAKFFTKSFELGFSPKYILLTAETETPPGASVRYGITNSDSTKEDVYEFFTPNKVVELTRMPVTGEKVKLLIEMSGSYGDPVVVHEFAVMFSDRDETQVELNR